MAHVPDDILMAFVDGELSDEQQAWLEGLLHEDATLRRRLEPFAVTRAALPVLFDQPLHEPVPDYLVAFVRDGVRPPPRPEAQQAAAAQVDRSGLAARGAEGTRSASSAGRGLTQWLSGLFEGPGLSFGPALGYAAVLLLGVGTGWFGAGYFTHGGDSALVRYENGSLIAAEGLIQALDTLPSGGTLDAPGPGGRPLLISPVVSFRTFDGRVCRQYQILAKEAPSFAGLACRAQDGIWRVTLHSEAPASSTTIQTSYDRQPKLVVPALDAAVDRMIEGEPLAQQDEDSLIRRSWSVEGGSPGYGNGLH